jgi:glutamate N-acetyltransferase/amino-acid N-acetyltransferase
MKIYYNDFIDFKYEIIIVFIKTKGLVDKMVSIIEGGLTAPKGFTAAGVSCGLKKDGKKDFAIICADDLAVCAGVFTTNKVKGHSLKLTMENIKTGYARALVINSGNANALLGDNGDKDAKEMTTLAASLLNCEPSEILVGSTGVIGLPLNMPSVRSGIRSAVSALSPDGGKDAASAILTTDNLTKEFAVEIELQDEKVRIGGMAKGSGTVHPNMATMIGVITTDVNISKSLLQKALKDVVTKTFNRISVNGETSICDMVIIMANGASENTGILKETFEYSNFVSALEIVCSNLAKSIAKDAEGATKLIEVYVENAATEEEAKTIAHAIAKSPLVKSAMHNNNPNIGSIVTACGYSGVDFDPNILDVSLCGVNVCKNSTIVKYDESQVLKLLKASEIKIGVNLKKGIATYSMWTCD